MTRRLHALLVVLVLLLAGAAVAGGAPAGAHPTSTTDTDHDDRGPTVANPGGTDNCPDAFNPDQIDTDGDARPNPGPGGTPSAPPTNTGGDACDTDDDADEVDDALDNCRVLSNRSQGDTDGDGDGDPCDEDDDADAVIDTRDNCIKVANPDQADRDDDFVGDACDPKPATPGPRNPATSAGPPAAAPGAGSTAARPGPPAGPPDGAVPAVKLSLGRVHRLEELGGGLAVPVSVSERSVLSAAIMLDARTAQRLGLTRSRAARPVMIATGSTEVDEAGRTFVFARFAPRTLRRLARARSVRPTLRLVASDPTGNAVTLTRRLSLRR